MEINNNQIPLNLVFPVVARQQQSIQKGNQNTDEPNIELPARLLRELQNSALIAKSINSKSIAHKENKPYNQKIFDINIDNFTRQCKLIFNAMNRGEVLTTKTALLKYGIGDLRARVRDLISLGIVVQKRLIDGRYKEYFF